MGRSEYNVMVSYGMRKASSIPGDVNSKQFVPKWNGMIKIQRVNCSYLLQSD